VRIAAALRARVARRLERGDPSRAARSLASLWGALARDRLARPLSLPPGLAVIGVGSAVLGGAGKTPLAVALARALHSRAARVALVSHAYQARPERARVVKADDLSPRVGDDALASARALADLAVPVIVAPTRQLALDHAASLGARVVVVDGLLQSAPARLHAAILVLDALTPWGSLACPPAGDLRAPRDALLAASDLRALIVPDGASPADPPPGALLVRSRIEGASAPHHEGRSLAELAQLRTGLLLTVARPERIVSTLARAGVEPRCTHLLADHASPSPSLLALAARAPVDLWLTTARCAVKLPPVLGAAPVLALEHTLEVDLLASALVDRLASFC
jgi:tetraacyldisaccharide 4'-kinase